MSGLREVLVKRLHEDAFMPERKHDNDAGLDLRAMHGRILPAGNSRHVFETGIAVDIPEGYVGYVCPRSGLAAEAGITVLNAPGVIDAGYHGDLSVVLINTGRSAYLVEPGDKIAQLVIQPIVTPKVTLLSDLGLDDFPVSARDVQGFGSSGR